MRKYLCWIHLFTAFVCLRLAAQVFISAGSFTRFLSSPRSMVDVGLMGLFAAVFAGAWWTFLKSRRSARVWAFAASSQFVFVNILPTLMAHHLRPGFPILLALGIVGFVVYAKPLKAKPTVAHVEEAFAIPGDFTSHHLNRIAQGVTFGLSLGAYLWWQGWLKTEHITVLNGITARSLLTIMVLFAITSIHESGHAIVGMVCGMKLRAFFIGPLQWRVREAKWEFEFRPKGFLLADGVTALIPGNGQLRRRQYLSMMAAGSLLNMISGAIALFAASRYGHAIPLPLDGAIALFGAWSFGLAAANLLPFRTPQGYSDGAIVLQLLRGNAFADFHLSTAKIGSSLVSALRPRDYDIGSIRRAARGIASGRQALLLWLYAFSHSIDSGHTQEADDVLAQAELVCLQSAPNIPAEMHTSFVFGNALIRRDPVAARFWWNRMQASKPTRFNADYWRAESALHWIEGNLEEARTAWKKSNDLAMELPQAGAYDFSRYCCTLLRDELDHTAAAA
jgi:Peptidase family M50